MAQSESWAGTSCHLEQSLRKERCQQETLKWLFSTCCMDTECPLVPGFRKYHAARQSLHVVAWNSAFGSVSRLQLQSSGLFVVVALLTTFWKRCMRNSPPGWIRPLQSLCVLPHWSSSKVTREWPTGTQATLLLGQIVLVEDNERKWCLTGPIFWQRWHWRFQTVRDNSGEGSNV